MAGVADWWVRVFASWETVRPVEGHVVRWLHDLFDVWGDVYVAINVAAATLIVALTAATVYGYAT